MFAFFFGRPFCQSGIRAIISLECYWKVQPLFEMDHGRAPAERRGIFQIDCRSDVMLHDPVSRQDEACLPVLPTPPTRANGETHTMLVIICCSFHRLYASEMCEWLALSFALSLSKAGRGRTAAHFYASQKLCNSTERV